MESRRGWNFGMALFISGLWLGMGLGCGPAAQDQTLHKLRLSIPAEPKAGRLDDQQMEEIFYQALSTGIQLGYRVAYANPEQGILSLAKELSPDHVPVNLNVQIQREAERTAYAEIIFQCPRLVDESHISEFKNAFSARLKRKVVPLAAETPPAGPQEKAGVKPEPAKIEAKGAPEKAPVSIQAIASRNARIRLEPSPTGKILQILQNPTKVQKLGQSGDWVKVKLPSGEVGWVFKNLIKEERTSG
jgi:hypothetical protein